MRITDFTQRKNFATTRKSWMQQISRCNAFNLHYYEQHDNDHDYRLFVAGNFQRSARLSTLATLPHWQVAKKRKSAATATLSLNLSVTKLF